METNPDFANIEYLPQFEEVFSTDRKYITLSGGRGSGKSWQIARKLVLDAYFQEHRVLCCREIQKSIKESVIAVLEKQIKELGLESFFDVQRDAIHGKNGSQFIFMGLKMNATAVKSMEGITRVWVEEAESVSETSWRVLLPTIRTEGAQVLLSFNPQDELDATYQRFVVDPPENSIHIHSTYLQNPKLDKESVKEAEDLKVKNKTMYEHIYLGECLLNKDGAYYAQILAENPDHITRVPVENSLPVNTAWDLGMKDYTAIWFYQQLGTGEIRLVHYYENNSEGLNHYINYLHSWRDKYQVVYGHHFAPHDIAVRELGTGKSRAEVAKRMGITFQMAPRLDFMGGVNQVRNNLHRCWFDKEECMEGIRALRSYRKEFNERTGIFNDKPLHDHASHGADAFRYLITSIRNPNTHTATPVQAAGFDIF